MTRPDFRVALVFALLLTLGPTLAFAQEPPAAAPPAEAPQPVVVPPAGKRGLVPLEVKVVISRYQGEKQVSSMPYVMAVNANGPGSQLNMGAEVPVPMTMMGPQKGDQEKGTAISSFSYRSIGTSIDCQADTVDDGRFGLVVAVDESSVLSDSGDTTVASLSGVPVFRSFKSRNRLLLRDGQTRQYTAATDRVNGETVRIDVTLKVLQ